MSPGKAGTRHFCSGTVEPHRRMFESFWRPALAQHVWRANRVFVDSTAVCRHRSNFRGNQFLVAAWACHLPRVGLGGYMLRVQGCSCAKRCTPTILTTQGRPEHNFYLESAADKASPPYGCFFESRLLYVWPSSLLMAWKAARVAHLRSPWLLAWSSLSSPESQQVEDPVSLSFPLPPCNSDFQRSK